MNIISMSVSARIKQYGAMRAVGMDTQQMTKMIAAEAATYALPGCVVGLLLSKLLYDNLITTHFAYAVWSFPVIPLTTILLFVLATYRESPRVSLQNGGGQIFLFIVLSSLLFIIWKLKLAPQYGKIFLYNCRRKLF